MKQMKMRAADILSAAVVLAVIAALFALNFFIRPVL
jgi:hypothetical protein